MVSLWDVLPVVSTLDTLPAVRVWPWSLCGWSACSRLDVLPVDGEPVGCVACGWGLVAVVVSDGEPVGWSACSQYPRHIASL